VTGSAGKATQIEIKGEVMRDQTRNIETFKVGATRVNEFEFHKHQGEMNEHFTPNEEPIPNEPATKKERIAQLTKQAHEKVLRRRKRR
jgi:hypothetical protein